jgi:CheY-like chemotaxis protein
MMTVTAASTPGPAGARPRVLVVEDEAIVAMMLEDMLDALGYAPVGPAMTVGAALDLLAAGGVDAAILDINVGGQSSVPVAAQLEALALPFAFATGYTSPPCERFVAAPLLQKPYVEAELRRVLEGFFA